MDRIEIIAGVERRRRYLDEERAANLAMCDEPKATIVGVARRLGMSPGLIHGWRRMRFPRAGKILDTPGDTPHFIHLDAERRKHIFL